MSKHYTSRERRQKNLKYAAVILAAILLVSSGLLLVRIWENYQSRLTEFGSETVSSNLEYKGNEYELKEDIETVLIPTNDRFSVCVSTQIGCAQNCAFCRTAKMGFIRNLEAGEILEEIIRVNWYLEETGTKHSDGSLAKVTNIIFMGMGEPLNNLEQVHRVCCTLHHQKLFNLGRKRMTISTSGVVPKIKELVDRNTPCCLAVSLNSTNDERRSAVMPVNKVWNIAKLLEATDEYTKRTGNYVTFEFVLMKGITCSEEAAKELIRICAPRRCKVNAIVLNDGDDPTLEAPSLEEIDHFLEIVRKAEVQITIRNPRGRDILAACGQLAYNTQQGKTNADTELT